METQNTSLDDVLDDDIYVRLKGPAQIRPLSDTIIEVTFLDTAGVRKEPLVFTLATDPDLGIKVLKIKELDIIIESDREKFDELKRERKLELYFPESYEEISKLGNQKHMNPPPPPFGRG